MIISSLDVFFPQVNHPCCQAAMSCLGASLAAASASVTSRRLRRRGCGGHVLGAPEMTRFTGEKWDLWWIDGDLWWYMVIYGDFIMIYDHLWWFIQWINRYILRFTKKTRRIPRMNGDPSLSPFFGNSTIQENGLRIESCGHIILLIIFQRSLSTSFCDFVRVCRSLSLSLQIQIYNQNSMLLSQWVQTIISMQSRASFLPHVMSKPFHVSWAVQPSGSKSIRTTCQPSDDEKLEASSCSCIPWGTWDQNLPMSKS